MTLAPTAWRLLSCVPLVIAALATYTITECARLTFEANILPASMRFPPISLFGIRPGSPEQSLYAHGFLAVAGLHVVCILPIASFLRTHVERERSGDVTKATWSSIVAFVALAVHGVVPLHEDVLKLVRGHRGPVGGEVQNAVHQGAAAVFFLVSMYHGWVVIQLMMSSTALPIAVKAGGRGGRVAVGAKMLCLALQFFPALVSLLLHPASRALLGLEGLELSAQDKVGLSQWWTVGAVAAFYLTYSIDCLNIASYVEEAGAERERGSGAGGGVTSRAKTKTEHGD